MTTIPVPNPDPAAPPPAAPAAPPAPTGSAPIAPPGPAPAAPPAPPAPAAPAPAPTDPDAGAKTALEAERTARKVAEQATKEAKAELEQLKKGPLSESEQAIAAAKLEGKNEATAASNTRIIQSEIKVAAAGKLADPGDAVTFIDASTFKVADDGSIEGDIAAAIDKLVADKPYLATAGVTPPKPGPVGGGPQGTTPAVTREQLKKMSPQQIAELDPKLIDAALAAP